jgi:hypothetical protein
MRLADRVLRSDDRDPLKLGYLIGPQILVVKSKAGRRLPPDPVAPRKGDVDLEGVNVAQLIELQRRLVREHAERAPWPESRFHVRV